LVNEQTGCQKVIGVKNLHARVTEPSKSTTKLSHTSNSEDIISEDDKSLSNTSVSVSNTEVSPNNTTHIFNSANVDEIGEVNAPDSSLYFNSGPFDDENSCDRDTDPQSEDGDFSDNDKEKDDDEFCGFSDDDEGYYYDLNTGETYTKSDRSICAY